MSGDVCPRPSQRLLPTLIIGPEPAQHLLALFGSKGASGTLFVDGRQVAQGRIPQTAIVRFSLDKTFDVGEDTGTPVVEEYADKMPLPFRGTLKKLPIVR